MDTKRKLLEDEHRRVGALIENMIGEIARLHADPSVERRIADVRAAHAGCERAIAVGDYETLLRANERGKMCVTALAKASKQAALTAVHAAAKRAKAPRS